MNDLFRIRKFIEYQWKAKTKYYIHSPFVFQFYLNVLEESDKTPVKGKHGKFIYRLTKYFKPQNILLLRDSDFSQQYFALANPEAKIASIQNSAGIIQWENYSLPDLIHFDGNFNKEITLEYFHQCILHKHENSIFIFDDIYGSKEMNEAWHELIKHPQITLTLDVFQFGICFFRKEKLSKENFVLRY